MSRNAGRPERAGRASITATTAGAVVVVALLLLAAGGVVVLGLLPGGAGSDSGVPPSTTTAAAGANAGTGGSGSGSGDGSAAVHVRPFGLSIDGVASCGTTCRDVTASLTNNGGHARENVTVTTEVYAGNDRVWRGSQSLGSVGSHETVTRTPRVDVGYVGAAKIKGNDGYVTIVTTVHWTGGSATYRNRERVA